MKALTVNELYAHLRTAWVITAVCGSLILIDGWFARNFFTVLPLGAFLYGGALAFAVSTYLLQKLNVK